MGQNPCARQGTSTTGTATLSLRSLQSCQLDLVKDNGHNYFINVLATTSIPSDQRTMAAFVLSSVVDNCRPGQSACLNGELLTICLAQINEPDAMLRRWIALCIGKLWELFDEAKWVAIRENAHKKLCGLLTDPVPEVRCPSSLSNSSSIPCLLAHPLARCEQRRCTLWELFLVALKEVSNGRTSS